MAVRITSGFALLAIGMFTIDISPAQVTTTFGETVPTANIITSYEPITQDAFTWLRIPDTNRVVSQSFIIPEESDYSLSSISMKLNQTLSASFPAPSGFTIDFYELSSPGQNPTTGTFLATQTGTMQPTTAQATANSYFTFSLDAPLTLSAGTSYAYVLAFTSVEEYNLLRLAISSSAPDPAGTRAWSITDGGSWTNSGETYVYYLQGTSVPEPGMLALLAIGVAGTFWRIRRSRNPAKLER